MTRRPTPFFKLASGFALALALALATASAFAAPTAADREAKREFADGQRAFEAGDYRRAAAAFEAAYAAKPHHASLWNAARSWQRAGEDLRAVNLFERYLHEAPRDAPDRDQANRALAEVGQRLGHLELHFAGVTDGRLDGEPAATGKSLYVAPGDHVLTASAGAKPVRKVVSLAPGQILSVTLAPPEEPPPPPPPPPVPESRGGLPPWSLAVGGGLVAVSGTFTIFSGLETMDKRDAFLADRNQDRLDEAFGSQTRTNVLIATTAGLAVITAALAIFFVDWKGDAGRTGRRPLDPLGGRF